MPTATTSNRHKQIIKSADNREQMYKQSFGDIEDGTLYRDVFGFKTGGNPVTLQKDWGEQLENTTVEWDSSVPGASRSSVLEKWNELQKKGASVKQTREIIGKSLDTLDWQLPLDIITDVFIVTPEQTPAAEFIPRRTTSDDVVHATPQTDQPLPEFGLEDGATESEDGDRLYEYGDPDYEDLEYEVEGYGIATRISDKMILSSANLRSPEATQEEALMTGHRQKTERQIIWGTEADAPAEGDAAGWGGFADFGVRSAGHGVDPIDPTTAEPEDYKATFEQLIDVVEENGASLSDIALFCGFDAHRETRRAYDDLVRYTAAEDIDTGFATFAMEGGQVPVFKSNAIPRAGDYPADDTNDGIFAVNMASVELAQLQEVMVQDLAKLGPQERMAVDQYNVLVSESGDGETVDAEHIAIGEYDVPA